MAAHVFLSYVRENSDLVDRLKSALELKGIRAWVDRDNLRAGQRWNNEISNAIQKASFFIACFSAESESRDRTQMNEEILLAIDELRKRPPDRDWFIPVRLSQCNIRDDEIGGGQRLSKIQWVDLFPDWKAGVRRLTTRLLAQPSPRKLLKPDVKEPSHRVLKTSSNREPPVPIATTSPSLILHSPGGAVPSNATPYVEREHDSLILDLLQLSSFAILVRGPSQCGKSTALALLERKANEVGIETARFEPQPPLSDTSHVKKSNQDADSALAVAELLQAKWGLRRPRRGTINTMSTLYNWLMQELAPTATTPRLLILDDLVTLGGAAAERWLSLFVRAIVNQHATRDINISVAVGLTDHFGVDFARKLMLISNIYWQQMLTLSWLDQQQVVTLWQRLRDKQATNLEDESLLNNVFTMFKGQPYLTHAALIDNAFRAVVQEWLTAGGFETATAVRQSRWYRQHRSAIRVAIEGPSLEHNADTRRLIRSFVESCSSSSQAIDPNHELFLKTAMLLDDQGHPSLEIYRLVAEDLATERMR